MNVYDGAYERAIVTADRDYAETLVNIAAKYQDSLDVEPCLTESEAWRIYEEDRELAMDVYEDALGKAEVNYRHRMNGEQE